MSVLQRAKTAADRAMFLASVPPLRRWWRARFTKPTSIPPVGLVQFGDLRRLEPFSRDWGDDRGGPVDRHYIVGFLDRNRTDVRGRVLEIAEDVYTRWFGDDRVTQIDILEYEKGENPQATLCADLQNAPHLPSNAFDCVILTQTLQLIYDLRGAIATVHRILKPGGVALVTVPGITPICRNDHESWGSIWQWSFTAHSMKNLFGEAFGEENLRIETHGNVLAATAFLYGMGRGELTRAELDHHDPDYEMLITVRAQKAGSTS